MTVLVGLAGEENEGRHDNGDAADSPEYLLYAGREAEVPGDEVEAAVSEHDTEEENGVWGGADDGEAIICEAREGSLSWAGAEGEVGLNFGEPGGRLVVNEV